jgi:hypothetical protein
VIIALGCRTGDLGEHVLRVLGGQELPLLDVDGASGRRGGEQQVGLPAKERRDLQAIDHFARRRRIAWRRARR